MVSGLLVRNVGGAPPFQSTRVISRSAERDLRLRLKNSPPLKRWTKLFRYWKTAGSLASAVNNSN